MGYHGAAVLHYVPALKHTYLSDVNLSKLPSSVPVVYGSGGVIKRMDVKTRDENGDLLESAIPSVPIVKDGGFFAEEYLDDPSVTADLIALVERKLDAGRLAGFIIEGTTPYGKMTSSVRQAVMRRAIYSGLPVARVGRGSPQGFADPDDYFIAGSNLTATKARMLLIACLLKFGSLPAAKDPEHPTTAELANIRKAVAAYQAVFDTH